MRPDAIDDKRESSIRVVRESMRPDAIDDKRESSIRVVRESMRPDAIDDKRESSIRVVRESMRPDAIDDKRESSIRVVRESMRPDAIDDKRESSIRVVRPPNDSQDDRSIIYLIDANLLAVSLVVLIVHLTIIHRLLSPHLPPESNLRQKIPRGPRNSWMNLPNRFVR